MPRASETLRSQILASVLIQILLYGLSDARDDGPIVDFI